MFYKENDDLSKSTFLSCKKVTKVFSKTYYICFSLSSRFLCFVFFLHI